MLEKEKPLDEPGGEPAGIGPTKPTYASSVAESGLMSTAAAPAVGGLTGGRSWRQIVEDAKKKNILQINIIKSVKVVDNETVKPRNLRHDDIATFIYDVLQIKHDMRNVWQ